MKGLILSHDIVEHWKGKWICVDMCRRVWTWVDITKVALTLCREKVTNPS